MQIPADMHKWRNNFAWQMSAYAVVMLLMAGLMLWQAWFFRAKFLAHPARMLFSTVGLIFAVAALISAAVMCIQLSISTRKHNAKIKELEKQRVPITLARLREDLQPENQERFRITTLKTLQFASPQIRGSVEISIEQLVEKIRADVGSTPETEVEIARLDALIRDVLRQAAANVK